MTTNTRRLVRFTVLALLCGVGAAPRLTPAEVDGAPASVYRLASAQQATATLGTSGRARQEPGSDRDRAAALEGARAFSAAFADVAGAATPAVVQIRTERTLEDLHRESGRYEDFFERLPEDHPAPDLPYIADGSGFLVSPDGRILTNNHVISGASRITVVLWDKRVFEARVVGADPTTDLALIAIDEAGLPTVELGDSDRLRVGEWVLAIGNPGFRSDNTLDFTVTSGIVSAKGRPLNVIQDELSRGGNPSARYAIEDFIQTDAAINPGNSGGPLLDLSGTVVGINTAIASANGVNQGYGFAVPINVARRVMADLLEYGHVRRPLLGISIQNVSPEDAEVYRLPRIAGVLVEDFADESPAEAAGMRRHDVIVALDGRPVRRLGQFQRLVAAHSPGDRVEVDVIRYGERHRMTVELTEADLGGTRVVHTRPQPRSRPELGLELVELTPSLARERRFPGPGGALIAAVAPGSPADRANVPRDVVLREVDRQPIESVAAAERILADLRAGAVVSLLVESAAGETFIRNVRIP